MQYSRLKSETPTTELFCSQKKIVELDNVIFHTHSFIVRRNESVTDPMRPLKQLPF